MTYLDSNYDQYFQRDLIASDKTISGGITPMDFSSQYQGFSGSQILGGLMNSTNGRVKIDLDNEFILISDGVNERVRLGKQSDGTYGLLIKDINGNVLMQIAGSNVIKSPDGNVELNFDNAQFLVRDSGGNIVALLGKQVGGF